MGLICLVLVIAVVLSLGVLIIGCLEGEGIAIFVGIFLLFLSGAALTDTGNVKDALVEAKQQQTTAENLQHMNQGLIVRVESLKAKLDASEADKETLKEATEQLQVTILNVNQRAHEATQEAKAAQEKLERARSLVGAY